MSTTRRFLRDLLQALHHAVLTGAAAATQDEDSVTELYTRAGLQLLALLTESPGPSGTHRGWRKARVRLPDVDLKDNRKLVLLLHDAGLPPDAIASLCHLPDQDAVDHIVRTHRPR